MPKYVSLVSNATDQPNCCVLTILNRVKTPFLGLQHRESMYLSRPTEPELSQNAMSGTLIMGTRETLATLKIGCARR
eukprot:4401004-Pyramimonas_sp.AAC.1